MCETDLGILRSDVKTGAFLDDSGRPLPLRWRNNLDWRVRWADVAGAVSLGFKIAVIAAGVFLIARGVSGKRDRPALRPSAAVDTTIVASPSTPSRRIEP